MAEQLQVQDMGQSDLLDKIKDSDLSNWLLDRLKNYISDREEYGWMEKREYDVNAYFGNKKVATYPWPKSSNFPVPITRNLLDVALANVMASSYGDPDRSVSVNGVAPEDKRLEKPISQILNWQVQYEIDAYEIWQKGCYRGLLNGTGAIKVLFDSESGSVRWVNVPIENLFVALNSTGFQIGQAECVIQIVGLNDGEWEERIQNGTYDGLEDVPKGMAVTSNTSFLQRITQVKDVIKGTSLERTMSRDMRYIAECYCTYWVETGEVEKRNGKEIKKKVPVELVVWIAPNGGKILKKEINFLGIRPYAEIIPYPADDRFYGESLPEIIRHIQEEADYAHKQNIDAGDIAIMPPAYYREGSSFNPEHQVRVPGAFIPVPEPGDIFVEQRSVNPIFERAVIQYREYAESLLGLTDLFQGRVAERQQTATADTIRTNKAEIRFEALYKRFEKAWSKLIYLTYVYDIFFMPNDKKIKVAGSSEYKTIAELFPRDKFPQGMRGTFNFGFTSKPLIQLEQEKQADIQFYYDMLGNPLVATDRGALYKATKLYAEARGKRDFESILPPPPEARMVGVDEALRRIMSGDLQIEMEVSANPQDYIFRIQKFIMTDQFKAMNEEQKKTVVKLLIIAQAIMEGQDESRQAIAQSIQQQNIQNNGANNGTKVQ